MCSEKARPEWNGGVHRQTGMDLGRLESKELRLLSPCCDCHYLEGFTSLGILG